MAQFSYPANSKVLFQIPPINGKHFHIWQYGDEYQLDIMLSEMKLTSGGVYEPTIDHTAPFFSVNPQKKGDMRKKVTQAFLDKCNVWIKDQAGDTQSGDTFPEGGTVPEQLTWIFEKAVSFDPKTLKLSVAY